MKLSILAVTAALATSCGGAVLAQATMQPIPNPPETMKPKAHAHAAKHHKKKAAPPAAAAAK